MINSLTFISRLVGICVLALAATTVAAQDASGTLSFTADEFALGIGGTKGTGKLVFKGKTYDIKMKSFDIAAVGWSKIDVTGKVYNLASVEDFPGKYKALSASMTIGKSGGSNTVLKSDSGVEIRLQSTGQEGAQIQVGGGGFEFTLE